jgi:Domain of unknown function (DUF4194)
MTATADTSYGGRHSRPATLDINDGEEAPMSVAGPGTPSAVDAADPAANFGEDDSNAFDGGHGGNLGEDDNDAFADGPGVVEDADVEGRSLSLFEGDEGSLTYEQRCALVFLLRHRYVSAEQHPAEWRTIIDAQVQLRSRLNDMFLDLHVDERAQVAFKRQAVPDSDGRFPTLLHDIAHTREETILLIFLRQRFRSERADGADAVIVDRQELLDAVTRFRPRDANDQSGDARRAGNAIESLQRSGILLRSADEQRLHVAPVIEVLLPLPRLHELLDTLLSLNGATPAGDPDEQDLAAGPGLPDAMASGGEDPGGPGPAVAMTGELP